MRIVFLGNNWLGSQILKWLCAQGEQIAACVMHPPERCKYGEEIREALRGKDCLLFQAGQLRDPEVLAAIKSSRPDLGVSVLFGYILRTDFLNMFPAGCINLHPALLPFNRGAYPNVWSIVEGTPAGATLHYIDAGVDTGDIIGQKQVVVEPVDTGASLYRKLEQAALELFCQSWPLIREGRAPRLPQPGSAGSFHRVRDVENIDEIHLDRTYTGKELLDILRARTFPPHRGAYFHVNSRRVFLQVHLEYEDPSGEGPHA